MKKIIGICNTGPMISAIQCESIKWMREYFSLLIIPQSAMLEYDRNNVLYIISGLIDTGFLDVHALDVSERILASTIAQDITKVSSKKDPAYHYTEAEAIALMERGKTVAETLIIDEIAARVVAENKNLPVIGFPGILGDLCGEGFLEPQEVKNLLLDCIRQGTHYSQSLIDKVYNYCLKLRGLSE